MPLSFRQTRTSTDVSNNSPLLFHVDHKGTVTGDALKNLSYLVRQIVILIFADFGLNILSNKEIYPGR